MKRAVCRIGFWIGRAYHQPVVNEFTALRAATWCVQHLPAFHYKFVLHDAAKDGTLNRPCGDFFFRTNTDAVYFRLAFSEEIAEQKGELERLRQRPVHVIVPVIVFIGICMAVVVLVPLTIITGLVAVIASFVVMTVRKLLGRST